MNRYIDNLVLMLKMTQLPRGELRPIAPSGAKRSIATPNVPTFAESGLPSFDLNEWFVLFAPDQTLPELIARLNNEIMKVLASSKIRVIYDNLRAKIIAGSLGEATVFYRTDTEKVGKLVTTLGLIAE